MFQCISDPANLPTATVVGIAIIAYLSGMGIGVLIGKSSQRKFDAWFYHKGPRPRWMGKSKSAA